MKKRKSLMVMGHHQTSFVLRGIIPRAYCSGMLVYAHQCIYMYYNMDIRVCEGEIRQREKESATSFQTFQAVRKGQESAITVRYVLAIL